MPVVELCVDRSLVCPNFDGYKLSFDPVPVLEQQIECEPLHLLPHQDQYSLLHVEVFGRHNHLFADPWQRHCSYYINVRHQLMQCLYDPQSGHSLGQRVVYTIDYRDQGDGYQHLSGDYNYSVSFISERFCVICDGMTSYHLLDTGDRSRPGQQAWERITRTPVNHTSEYRGFVLYDARLDVVQERKQISLLAGHVARRDKSLARERVQVHYMDLTWARWTQSPASGEWSYSVCQRLETTGSVLYCAFEPRAESLIIASNREVQTPEQRRESDEAEAVAPTPADPPVPPVVQVQNGDQAHYRWTQTTENVHIRFEVPTNASKDDFNVSCTSNFVEVKHLDEVLFTGQLYARLNEDFTTWTLEAEGLEGLEVTLSKDVREHWPRLLAQEEDGGEAAAPLPIPNLEDPIEECDLGLADEDVKMVFRRITSILDYRTKPLFSKISILCNPPTSNNVGRTDLWNRNRLIWRIGKCSRGTLTGSP
ncbi:nudC domain-containing protein 1-like isoform X4 [Drosophila biarmipes]|uniref:nudC domain-containing protein 1-like isoform X3 n=1 Tax=Drosophila biarmipes TaxID=125945 RepID=UPI0021CCA5F2|nr:nudC domain-containing protein 1-like isoform X3 [Drosophila biarmipes]XP_050740655.1 nudC domain-containing protein 1-like isoform X4 [Drosophila biarmipes]